jgi:hypothetical protein
MAKGYDKDRARRDTMQGYPASPDAALAKKLGEIVSDLYLSTDESDVKRLWGSAHRLLLKSKADQERVATIMKQRRIGALSTLVHELEAGSKPSLRSAASISGVRQATVGDVPTSNPPSMLQAPAAVPVPSAPAGDAAAAPSETRAVTGPSADQLKSALKAFRKRLKLTRLDDESRLGNRAMTGGRKSSVVAIMPPREYPRAVWDELVKQGKLRPAGSGFYELIGD